MRSTTAAAAFGLLWYFAALPLAGETIPRFEPGPNPIALAGSARPTAFLEASGRRAAFLGREDGSFEAWVYPLKVFRDFELAFRIESYAESIPAASLATEVEVRPESARLRFTHAEFTADVTWFVPHAEPGGLVLLDLEASIPVVVEVRFRTELLPMWPAGLGGQYSYWDEAIGGFVLTEGTRRHAAIVGSPLAVAPKTLPAHNLPDAPTLFEIPVTPSIAGEGLIPIAMAASLEGLEAARLTYRRLLGETERLYRETEAHYRSLREERTVIDTPDDALDLAFEWGKVALDKGFVCNPQLGCGLIAGLGPSGRSTRPGFGWFFGGDAFINFWAIAGYGDFETVRRSLRFLRDRQRADGKMMHELSQGAAYIRWFEDYPYGYYHGDTTPFYILAVRDFYRLSGDRAFLEELWPSVRRAYDYCRTTDENGDGLMDNSLAGMAAVETGALRTGAIRTDVYLATVWVAALEAMPELARAVGEAELEEQSLGAFRRASASLETSFLDDEQGLIRFALLRDGTAQPESTVWPALGLWRELFDWERPAVRGALDRLAGSGIGTDWGARMLSRESELYQHRSYNNGAVWPFVTGFAALALYRGDRPEAAWSYLEGLKEVTFLGDRGYLPELLSGDRLRALDAAVPHQLFATSGLIGPLLLGLIGLQAEETGLELHPRLLSGWDSLKVERLRFRDRVLSFDWQRSRSSAGEGEDELLVTVAADAPLPVTFHLDLEPGAELRSSGRGTSSRWSPGWDSPRETARFRVRPGFELVPIHEPLRLGDRSRRLRVIETKLEGRRYLARLEGVAGRSYRLRLGSPRPIETIENARELSGEGRWRVLEIVFPEGPEGPGGDEEWSNLELTVTLEPSRSP